MAQFGQRYGIANCVGSPNDATARALLERAWNLGSRSFDTARAYANAEMRMRDWLSDRLHGAMAISKLPRLAGDAVGQAFEDSEAALERTCLVAYLAHEIHDLGDPAVADALKGLMETARIAAFGVSVYTPEQAMLALGVLGEFQALSATAGSDPLSLALAAIRTLAENDSVVRGKTAGQI